MNSSDSKNPAPDPKGKPAGVYLFLSVLGAILVVLAILGIIPRLVQRHELTEMRKESVNAVREVTSITARPAAATESIKLPGNIDAIIYTTIYARVGGNLRSRLVDIGDHVKKGQMLAVIDTPTVDDKVNKGKRISRKHKRVCSKRTPA